MAKRLLLPALFAIAFITACSEKKQKKDISIADTSKVTKLVPYIKSSQSDTLYANGAPKITSLPFWSKEWPKPGKKFVIVKKNYRIPIIKSIRYMNLDSLLRYKCTNGEPIDSSILKLTQYNYKFPNIGKYQVFCKWVSNGSYGNDPLTQFIKKNCKMFYDVYGYLILYDPLAMKAIVLNVSNDYYIDAVEERDFFIDKNYNIHLIDSSWTDADEDSHGNQTVGFVGSQKRTISILKNGEINITGNK